MVQCTAPYCTDEAKFSEPSENAENGEFRVCKRHVDPTVDGVVQV